MVSAEGTTLLKSQVTSNSYIGMELGKKRVTYSEIKEFIEYLIANSPDHIRVLRNIEGRLSPLAPKTETSKSYQETIHLEKKD